MVLTFALGIAPATWLLCLSVLFAAAGVARLFEVGVASLFEVGNLGLAVLGLLTIVLSIFGYVALFHAAGDEVTPKVARWLFGGVVANLLGIGFVIGLPVLLIRWEDVFALFSPLPVGCAHLTRYLIGARQRVASV
jgi:hypothetical protein